MKTLGYDVEVDSFNETNTVVGPMDFHNIIATHDTDAPRRLVLACHYDSKVTPGTNEQRHKLICKP
jgi:glutaminyl-peptide cyclotransferase